MRSIGTGQYVTEHELTCDLVDGDVVLEVSRTELNPTLTGFFGCSGLGRGGCPVGGNGAVHHDRCPYFKSIEAVASASR